MWNKQVMRWWWPDLDVSSGGNERFSLLTGKYFEDRRASLLMANTRCLRREESRTIANLFFILASGAKCLSALNLNIEM